MLTTVSDDESKTRAPASTDVSGAAAQEIPPGLNVCLLEPECDYFSKTGPLSTAWNEARQFPRFHYRHNVAVRIYPPGDSLGTPVSRRILTRDISRGGMSLVHSEPFQIEQCIEISLPGGLVRCVAVLWCRKIGERCYLAGCRFIKRE